MRFNKKHIALLMSLALLSGCSTSSIKVKDGKSPLVSGGDPSVESITLQTLYNKLYSESGVSLASKEIVDQIAQKVLLEAYLTEEEVNNVVAKRVKEYFNTYYTNTYKVDGYFNESLLINALRKQGYNISADEFYVETFADLKDPNYKYTDLVDHLKGDYSDLINRKFAYDARLELLKEQYILQEKETLFTTTRIRKVEYIALPSLGNDSDDSKLVATLESKVQNYLVTENSNFKDLSLELEEAYREYKLDSLAKEFAPINYKALDMEEDNKKYEEGDLYGHLALDYEYDYTDRYINVYSKRYRQEQIFTDVGGNIQIELRYVEDILGNYEKNENGDYVKVDNPYLESKVSEVKSRMSTYSNNGARSIYLGYEEKQQNIYNTKYYTKKVGLNTSAFGTTITSDIDAQVFKAWTSVNLVKYQKEGLPKDSNLLDYYGTNDAVFKVDGTFYVVKVTNVSADSDELLKLEGAKALTQVSANVKDALKHYMTTYNLLVHEEALYTYLENTYSYTSEKKK